MIRCDLTGHFAQGPGGAFVKANGGTVEFLPLLEGYSTTETVAKVRAGDT